MTTRKKAGEFDLRLNHDDGTLYQIGKAGVFAIDWVWVNTNKSGQNTGTWEKLPKKVGRSVDMTKVVATSILKEGIGLLIADDEEPVEISRERDVNFYQAVKMWLIENNVVSTEAFDIIDNDGSEKT